VIRDEQGQVLLSAWGIIDNASSAEQVELVACNEGVKLAARWVPRPAILESDCPTAVNLILKPILKNRHGPLLSGSWQLWQLSCLQFPLNM
jgi:hypothetical protein